MLLETSQDSVVFKRVENLLYKIYPTLINYPKVEHHQLCSDIKSSFYNMLSCISQADSVRSKRVFYLQQADGYLQHLKIQYKLSKYEKYISIPFFEEIDIELTLIDEEISNYIKKSTKR